MDHINGPITALAFVNLKSRLLILAGNGPLLQVYSQFTRKLLYSKHVFGTQSIHGITPAVTSDVKIGKDSCTQCLIWGGCSIGVIQLDSAAECENQFHLKIQDLVTEVQVEDWILNACFRPVTRSTKFDDVYGFEAVLITSHNVLLRLYIPPNSSSPDGGCVSVNRVAAGPRSILYSAHVLWPPNQRGLVAAGTVYGEVLVWSFGDYTSSRPTSPAVALHYTFQGHDGSVFGVRISEECLNSGSRSSQRLLASCSDDRTIKIWKLSLTDSLTDSLSSYSSSHTVPLKSAEADSGSHAEKESSPLATAMGHASRIWDLHFLFEADSNWHLLSLGEDSTAQIWQIQRQSHTPDDISNSVKSFLLHHHVTYKSHSGKSIWSSAVYNKTQGSRLVCTGGSDGRLVCFNLHKQRFAHLNNTFSAHWTIEKVTKDLDSLPRTSKMKLRAQSDVEKPQERIFNALEGRWKLHRILKSARPTYPSGVFDGIAVFEKRFPVDPVYDTEYLYIENGNFTTLQGLSLTATRRYVYRFNKDTNTISVWFVKSEDGSTVDYLYHELDFAALNHASPNLTVEENGSLIKAAGYHPCVDDDYHADYYFPYSCVGFDTWRLKHTVKGPQKDYIADAQYVRESTSEGLSADVNLGQGIGETPIISTVAKKPKALENSSLNADSFKTYTWINETEFLISTEQGWLLLGNSSISNENNDLTEAIDSLQVRWERIAQIQDLTSSCIPSRIPSQEMVVLAGTSGTIYLYRHHNNFISYLSKVSGKIAYLKSSILHPDSSASWPKELETFETGIVISCLGSSLIYFLGFKIATRPSTYSKILDLGLERRPGFTVTSSCYAQQKKLLILGSRNGALTFYNIYTDQNDAGNVTSSLYVDHVHGDDAVNVIEIVPTSFLETELNGIFLLTAGRDGKFAIHQIKFDIACQPGRSIEFQTMHVCTPPFGPCIEGACFDNDSHDVLLWGFRSRQFVVWNETRKTETMTVECGGSHRNWAFSPSSTNPGGGTLIWTKASACHVHSQSYTSHQVLRYGGHGREIKAMAISPPNRGMDGFTRRFLATGAEDTNIRIFDRSTDNPADFHEHFRCLAIFPQHKTGIQQLRWSSDGQRLFSAAGCEEFFVWRIRPMPCLELGFVREAQCSPITESADLRIMDFDEAEIWDKNHEGRVHAYLLSMVYSDSSVRIYHYSSSAPCPTFRLLATGTYTTACLTKAAHIRFGPNIQLCTASTDGHIATWPLAPILHANNISITPSSTLESAHPTIAPFNTNVLSSPQQQQGEHLLITPSSRTPIHQSAITALCHTRLSPSSILLATGGDDGALALTLLSPFRSPSSPFPNSVLLVPAAHASALTALAFVEQPPSPTPGSLRPGSRDGGHHARELPPSTSSHPPPSFPATTTTTTTTTTSTTATATATLLTAGPDQRLRTWYLSHDASAAQQQQQQQRGVAALGVTRGKGQGICVGDLSCLGVWHGSGDGDGEEEEDGKKGEEGSGCEKRRKGEAVEVVGAGIGMQSFFFRGQIGR